MQEKLNKKFKFSGFLANFYFLKVKFQEIIFAGKIPNLVLDLKAGFDLVTVEQFQQKER